MAASHSVFQPPEKSDLHRLLEAISLGKAQTVHAIIEHDPSLLYQHSDFTDITGRQFHSISPIQYAFWALDYTMWEMIVSAIPNTVDGDNVRHDLERQYQEHQKNGVLYTYGDKKIRETHYNPNLFIKTLFDYAAAARPSLTRKVDTSVTSELLQRIHLHELILPVYFAQRYAQEKDLAFDSDFHFLHKDKMPRPFQRKITVLLDGEFHLDWHALLRRNPHIVICRGLAAQSEGYDTSKLLCRPSPNYADIDAKAIHQICKEGEFKFNQFSELLKQSMHLNHTPDKPSICAFQ